MFQGMTNVRLFLMDTVPVEIMLVNSDIQYFYRTLTECTQRPQQQHNAMLIDDGIGTNDVYIKEEEHKMTA